MVSIIKIISIILIFVFVILSIFFSKKAAKIKKMTFRKIVSGSGKDKKESIKERWQAVLNHLNSVNESDWKLAIIEADKIIDNLLTEKGLKGESIAEKLALIDKKELQNIDLLWEAHKIRNRIVHQTGFKLEYQEAKRAISYYQEALKELKIL